METFTYLRDLEYSQPWSTPPPKRDENDLRWKHLRYGFTNFCFTHTLVLLHVAAFFAMHIYQWKHLRYVVEIWIENSSFSVTPVGIHAPCTKSVYKPAHRSFRRVSQLPVSQPHVRANTANGVANPLRVNAFSILSSTFAISCRVAVLRPNFGSE